jgi:hypothetical protein
MAARACITPPLAASYVVRATAGVHAVKSGLSVQR